MSQAETGEYQYELPDDVENAEHEFGGGYLYRPRQLLIQEQDLDLVLAALNHHEVQLNGRPERVERTRFSVQRTASRERRSVPEIVALLRGGEFAQGGHRPRVYPVHVLYGAPHGVPHPATPPRPSGPLARPRQPGDEPGTGVQVAVLDSGAVAGHQFLGNRVSMRGGDVERPEFDKGYLALYSGHGTFVAGVILQHAPGATVIARRVFDGSGVIDDIQLCHEIQRLPEVEVINLSLGGYTHDDVGLPVAADGLDDLFQRNPRPVVVASAGNNGDIRPVYPAADKRVIAVGAVDTAGHRACFSDFGDWVDASSLGIGIQSTFLTVQAEPVPPQPPNCLGATSANAALRFDGWAEWSGTSFSAPRVAGAIAAMIRPGTDAQEAAFRLLRANGIAHRRHLGALLNPFRYA